MYREGVDSCEPVFIKNGCVIGGGAKKRVKKAEVGVLLLAPNLRFLLMMLWQLLVCWKTLRTQ